MFRTLRASQRRSLVNLLFGTTALFATATVVLPSLLPCPAMQNPYVGSQPNAQEEPTKSEWSSSIVVIDDKQSQKGQSTTPSSTSH
ncbi:cytochrome c oxidase assembly protein Coa2 [Schizosaccharomyces osmophilus]|uniref:Cytochrome c oxidase assembly protein Coa2 n=1 Tax=Schizosaccharomyces osmophilus TaxID=2545709 RepID=A0AAE9WCP3_9SCHI|nr:cytochrome c oxidase assembly protein Coa2 [Schizosaccharomyces osmophilus]WBW73423.1 cytochrome c oxidase assembly protein Coa2 [Schizosaccharomyces osmophilus]